MGNSGPGAYSTLRILRRNADVTSGAKKLQSEVVPDYGGRCFSEIPKLAQQVLLGGRGVPAECLISPADRYERCVLFLVDAFGWRFFERFRDRFPTLLRFARDGAITKFTSLFPSTTAACIPTLHFGVPPRLSGMYEWIQYDPVVEGMVSLLLYSHGKDSVASHRRRESLAEAGFSGSLFFPEETVYSSLARAGVRSHVIQFSGFTPSSFSDSAFKGAVVHPYRDTRHAVTILGDLLEREQSKEYYVVYIADFDSACHEHGPDTEALDQCAMEIFSALEEGFSTWERGLKKSTLFALTADHGQIEIDPSTTKYVDEQLPDFARYLKMNQRGEPLVPAGSRRDFFLHIQNNYLDEAESCLMSEFGGVAQIVRTQTLIEKGVFGPLPIGDRLRERIANLVILPNPGESVWWSGEGWYRHQFRGDHGGLSPEEMEIPLMLLSLGR